jgi:hypothetical protein
MNRLMYSERNISFIQGLVKVSLVFKFLLKLWASEKYKFFMDSWWQHCTHYLAGGHAPCFCFWKTAIDDHPCQA